MNEETFILASLFEDRVENMKNLLRYYQFWKTDFDLAPVWFTEDRNGELHNNYGMEQIVGKSLRQESNIIEFDIFSEGTPTSYDNIEILEEVARYNKTLDIWNPKKDVLDDLTNRIDARGLEGKKLWEQDWPYTKIVFMWGDRKAEWFPAVEHFRTRFKQMNKLKCTITLDINEYSGVVKTMQYLFNNRQELMDQYYES
jgi:hypothetical protein